MEEEKTRQAVFIIAVVVVIGIIIALISNMGLFMANAFWIALLAIFALLIWKFDFILMLQDYQRAVIMRFGKVNRVGGPGWCIVLPGIETPTTVDLRTQTVDVPKQDVITKENIELKVDAVIYLRVKDDRQSVINSIIKVEDYEEAVKTYLISSIRAIIGGMTLPEVIQNTEDLETRLQHEVEKITKNWGIEVISVDFKDVDIPKTVLDAMHEEKAAVQRKLARMEGAQAHMAEIDAVRKAAENLNDRALAYYYIKALEKLGEGRSTKFIFPMELSRLAEAVGGRVTGAGKPNQDVEQLFKQYAPAIAGYLGRPEKAKIIRAAKKKPKK